MNTQFAQPQIVDNVSKAFGGNINKLMPAYKDIPDEFKNWNNKWAKIQSTWFFSGLPKETEFKVKPGIDLNTALGHLKAIQSSWEPKHEHKQAGVAYLMAQWFDDIVIPAKK